jgi:predicted DCC family thiol-disulfide oxidoreductase YuxK
VARAAILYDPDCGFCRLCVALTLAWDRRRRLRPVALEDPDADALLAGMPPADRMASWHLAPPGGDVRSAGGAFAPLLRLLPGGAPLAALAERWPGAAERGYRWVADRRSALGRAIPRRLAAWAEARIASHC